MSVNNVAKTTSKLFSAMQRREMKKTTKVFEIVQSTKGPVSRYCVADELVDKHLELRHLLFLDDSIRKGPITSVSRAFSLVRSSLSKIGLCLNPTKCGIHRAAELLSGFNRVPMINPAVGGLGFRDPTIIVHSAGLAAPMNPSELAAEMGAKEAFVGWERKGGVA